MTTQIVNSILEEAKKHNAKKVIQVHLVIGDLTFLNPEQVRFWYKMLSKDTLIESSRLYIKKKSGSVKCLTCGYEGDFRYEDDPSYHVPIPTLICPRCGSIVEILSGKECTIKSIKLVV